MHKNLKLLVGAIFFSVGLIFGIISLVFVGDVVIALSGTEDVTATIVEITHWGDRPSVFVEYEVGGVTVRNALDWYRRDMQVGQSVRLTVSSRDPSRFIDSGDEWFIFLIFGIISIVFMVLGAGFLLSDMRSRAMGRWLLQHGTPVWAYVHGVGANDSLMVNGRPATVIYATYRNMQFISGPLNNSDLINLGEYVKVLFHPNNPDRYTFDLHNKSHLTPLEAPAPYDEAGVIKVPEK